MKEVYTKVTKDIPYIVYGLKDSSEKIILIDEGGISVKYGDGKVFETKSDPIALCRCGKSIVLKLKISLTYGNL